jgi:hypothetical protein
VSRSGRSPRSIQAIWFGVAGGPLIGIRVAQVCRRWMASAAHAQRSRPARQPTSCSSESGGGPSAASTMSVTSSSLAATYRYSDMVEAPRSPATRLMETAAMPSVAATFTAASTIRSRLSPRRGPLPGRFRSPQASSMLAGRPVPLSLSICLGSSMG